MRRVRLAAAASAGLNGSPYSLTMPYELLSPARPANLTLLLTNTKKSCGQSHRLVARDDEPGNGSALWRIERVLASCGVLVSTPSALVALIREVREGLSLTTLPVCTPTAVRPTRRRVARQWIQRFGRVCRDRGGKPVRQDSRRSALADIRAQDRQGAGPTGKDRVQRDAADGRRDGEGSGASVAAALREPARSRRPDSGHSRSISVARLTPCDQLPSMYNCHKSRRLIGISGCSVRSAVGPMLRSR